MMRLRVLAVVLLASALGVLQSPALPQGTAFRLVNPGYLTVGTYGTVLPVIIISPGDTMGGQEGALFNAFVRDHSLKLKLYQTTFSSMILAVEQGKIDAGTYVFYTQERAKHVYYTYPFFVSRAVIYTLKSFPYTGPESMNGQKVGTVVGFVWAAPLQAWSPSGAALFPDQTTVGQALLNGQIQGYVNGNMVIHAPPLSDSPNVVAHPLHPGDFTIPESMLSNNAYNIVGCANRGLAAALDRELATMHSTGEWRKALAANGLEDVPLKTPGQICSGG